MLSLKAMNLSDLLNETQTNNAVVYEGIENILKRETVTFKDLECLIQFLKRKLNYGNDDDKRELLKKWVVFSNNSTTLCVELLKEICDGFWGESIVEEIVSSLIVDQTLILGDCFKQIKDKELCQKIVDTLIRVSTSIPLKPFLSFIHINTIRNIFETNDDCARSWLSIFVLTVIKPVEFRLEACDDQIRQHVLDNFKNVYIMIIEDFRKSNNKIWYELCMFTFKYIGKLMHSEIGLLNALLSNIENGFKSKIVDDKILSFECWKVLIDVASLDRNYLCSAKQLRLLIKPLKVKLSRHDLVTQKRLEVWIHLFTALQENSLQCLDEFMNFCFEAETLIIKDVWLQRTEVFMNIIGHCETGDCCISPKTFTLNKPLIVANNILRYKNAILNALRICSQNMLVWEVKTGREQKMKCMWGSILRIISNLQGLDKELILRDLFVIMSTFWKKSKETQDYFDDILQPIFNILSSLDESFDYLLLNEIIVFPMAQLMLNTPDVAEYKALSFIKLLRSCSKTGSRVEYLNRSCELLTSYSQNKTQVLSAYIWLELANEMLTICRSPKDNEFDAFKNSAKFLMSWICECQIPDNLQKIICDKWISIMTEINVICEEFNDVIMTHFVKILKDNPTVVSNILEFIPFSIETINDKSSISYVTKVLDIVLEILKNPCLNKNKVLLAFPIISKVSAAISKGDSNPNEFETLDLKLFECLEYFLKPHQIYDVLKSFKTILPKLPQSLKKKLPLKLRRIINDLTTHSNSEIAQNAIALVADLDKQHLPKTPIMKKFVTPNVSNRTAKIASLSSSNNKQIVSPLNLFAQNVQQSPVTVKGSVINVMNTPRSSRAMKIANAMPSFKKPNSIYDANSQDFVYIDSEVNVDYSKMVSHQKEVLKRRKEDIPALYQDLSQSQHSYDSFSRSNDSLSVENKKENDDEISKKKSDVTTLSNVIVNQEIVKKNDYLTPNSSFDKLENNETKTVDDNEHDNTEGNLSNLHVDEKSIDKTPLSQENVQNESIIEGDQGVTLSGKNVKRKRRTAVINLPKKYAQKTASTRRQKLSPEGKSVFPSLSNSSCKSKMEKEYVNNQNNDSFESVLNNDLNQIENNSITENIKENEIENIDLGKNKVEKPKRRSMKTRSLKVLDENEEFDSNFNEPNSIQTQQQHEINKEMIKIDPNSTKNIISLEDNQPKSSNLDETVCNVITQENKHSEENNAIEKQKKRVGRRLLAKLGVDVEVENNKLTEISTRKSRKKQFIQNSDSSSNNFNPEVEHEKNGSNNMIENMNTLLENKTENVSTEEMIVNTSLENKSENINTEEMTVNTSLENRLETLIQEEQDQDHLIDNSEEINEVNGKEKRKRFGRREMSRLRMNIVGADSFVGVTRKRTTNLRASEAFKSLIGTRKRKSQSDNTQDDVKRRRKSNKFEENNSEIKNSQEDRSNELIKDVDEKIKKSDEYKTKHEISQCLLMDGLNKNDKNEIKIDENEIKIDENEIKIDENEIKIDENEIKIDENIKNDNIKSDLMVDATKVDDDIIESSQPQNKSVLHLSKTGLKLSKSNSIFSSTPKNETKNQSFIKCLPSKIILNKNDKSHDPNISVDIKELSPNNLENLNTNESEEKSSIKPSKLPLKIIRNKVNDDNLSCVPNICINTDELSPIKVKNENTNKSKQRSSRKSSKPALSSSTITKNKINDNLCCYPDISVNIDLRNQNAKKSKQRLSLRKPIKSTFSPSDVTIIKTNGDSLSCDPNITINIDELSQNNLKNQNTNKSTRKSSRKSSKSSLSPSTIITNKIDDDTLSSDPNLSIKIEKSPNQFGDQNINKSKQKISRKSSKLTFSSSNKIDVDTLPFDSNRSSNNIECQISPKNQNANKTVKESPKKSSPSLKIRILKVVKISKLSYLDANVSCGSISSLSKVLKTTESNDLNDTLLDDSKASISKVLVTTMSNDVNDTLLGDSKASISKVLVTTKSNDLNDTTLVDSNAPISKVLKSTKSNDLDMVENMNTLLEIKSENDSTEEMIVNTSLENNSKNINTEEMIVNTPLENRLETVIQGQQDQDHLIDNSDEIDKVKGKEKWKRFRRREMSRLKMNIVGADAFVGVTRKRTTNLRDETTSGDSKTSISKVLKSTKSNDLDDTTSGDSTAPISKVLESTKSNDLDDTTSGDSTAPISKVLESTKSNDIDTTSGDSTAPISKVLKSTKSNDFDDTTSGDSNASISKVLESTKSNDLDDTTLGDSKASISKVVKTTKSNNLDDTISGDSEASISKVLKSTESNDLDDTTSGNSKASISKVLKTTKSNDLDDTISGDLKASIPKVLKTTKSNDLDDTLSGDINDSISVSIQSVSPSLEPVKTLQLVKTTPNPLGNITLDDFPTGLNKNDEQNLPGSPIHEKQNSELLNNTIDISPIRIEDEGSNENENKIETESVVINNLDNTEHGKLDSQNDFKFELPSDIACFKSEIVKNFMKLPSARSMKLMNLLPQQGGVNVMRSPKSSSVIMRKQIVNVSGSPSSTERVRRMMLNCNGNKGVGDEKDKVKSEEQINEDINVLEFRKDVPSPFATPNRSILKRKACEALESGLSPGPKRKRVNFSDPPITAEKIYYKEQPEELSSENGSRSSELNKKKSTPIFPPLIKCPVDIKEVLTLISEDNNLYDNFVSLKLNTVGDLARLTSTHVNQMEFLNNPKVSTVVGALSAFADKYNSKEKLEEREESLMVPTEDASLPVNGDTENNALLVSPFERLKRMNTNISEIWQDLKDQCTRQELILISEDLREHLAPR